MIIEREKLMVPASTIHTEQIPKLKKSHFINPNPNSPNQPFPKPPINSPPIDPETIKQLTKSINFKGIKVPNESWKSWVDNLQKNHQKTWKKVGILDAIKSSTFTIKRDDELIIKLVNYWCPESNTFVFPWGECTITLEDVMVMGGLPTLGESVINLKECSNFVDVHAKLVNSCVDIKRKNNYHVPFNEWIKYFKGKGDDLEHVGFLVQWLSRYVFCVNQFDVDVNVFGFAVNLSQGSKIALAPAVLAAIYSDLTLLKRKIEGFNSDGSVKSKLVLWSPMQLVQTWAWERFPLFSPKPNCLGVGQPRVARWHKSGRLKTNGKGFDMDKCGGGFLWRPYARNLENWEFPKFYSDERTYVDVDGNKEVDEEWLSFARCLGVSELVGMDCVEQYLPHRVAMQFGLDQDIADFVPRLNGDLKLAWSSYDKPLVGVRLYVPPRLFEGEVTEEYSKLWVRVSPPLRDSLTEPEKKRRRKRQGSNQKAKKASNLQEFPLSTSRGFDNTIDFASPGSGKEPVVKRESFEVTAVSHRVAESSQPVNLIDKIDSSMAANGDLFLEVPSQVPDTERTLSVLAEDGQRNDTMEADFSEIINDEFSEWRRDYL